MEDKVENIFIISEEEKVFKQETALILWKRLIIYLRSNLELLSIKRNHKRVKMQPQELDKIFAIHKTISRRKNS